MTAEEIDTYVKSVSLAHYHLILLDHVNDTYRRDLDLLAGLYDRWLRKSLHDTSVYLAQRGLVGNQTVGEILLLGFACRAV